MKAAIKLLGALSLLAVGMVLAFLAFIHSDSTDCYAVFDSPGMAGRATALGFAAGFGDVNARDRGGPAGRIAVTFSDGETGDAAAALRIASC